VSSRSCCEPELESVGGNVDSKLGCSCGIFILGILFAAGGDLGQPG
jgi:hypothetical protein